MKKLLTILLSIGVANISFGQFSDNFESYTNGDYLAQTSPNWTTWSGTTGGSADVQVTNSKANSGNNSIYFSSTSATGGPQDIVLPFGGEFNTGVFVLQQSMFIESNKGAYFNLQADAVVGTTWALDVYFNQSGNLYMVSSNSNDQLQTTYPNNQWFDLKLIANLNTNDWALYIDNNLKGRIQNGNNQLASLDLFPLNSTGYGGNNNAGFYIDDCGYSHTPYQLPLLNAGISRIDLPSPVLAGVGKEPIIQVRNLGQTTITSFDISVTYNGSTQTKSVTGVSIDSLETLNVKLGQMFAIVMGNDSIRATVSNVNGNLTDNDANDDSKLVRFNSIEPAPGKLVIVEEATGTWCGWCPRGTVAMEFLGKDYHGFAQGIAVHNNDPMEYEKYDAGMGFLITGYPSALVDRLPKVDPSDIWPIVEDQLQIAPNALLEAGAKYDASSRVLDVSISVDFEAAVSGDWRIACVLVEDSVTGTTSQYNQSNSYSNYQDLIGVNGDNWKLKPSSVPASQMVYNHVARVISPDFDGAVNSFPTSVAQGANYVFNFSYTLPAEWDTDQMHIVGMLIDKNKRIDNGTTATIDEAVANGFVDGTVIAGVDVKDAPDNMVKLYPNPSNLGLVNVLIGAKSGDNVTVELIDQSGKVLNNLNYGKVSGPIQAAIPTDQLSEGIYIIRVLIGDSMEVRKLVLN